jgi:hypothetical protein
MTIQRITLASDADPKFASITPFVTARVGPVAINNANRDVMVLRHAEVEPVDIDDLPSTAVSIVTLTTKCNPAVPTCDDCSQPRSFLHPDAPCILSFGGGPHDCIDGWREWRWKRFLVRCHHFTPN